MRSAPVLLLLLLLLSAAPPARAGTAWSIDETLTLVDEGTLGREWRVEYDTSIYSRTWTLALPPGTTFVGARSPAKPLPATVTDGNVTVTTDGGVFFVELRAPLVREGGYLVARAGPSASRDSPTSVSLALPAGWTMPGWAGSEGVGAPRAGVWRATGPFFVEALLLPPGTSDPGPDPRGKVGGVAREARSRVGAEGAALDITVVYDTDVYSRTWLMPLPRGARVVNVTAPVPGASYTVEGDLVRIETPYPSGHHLGARAFTARFLVDATTFGGGYRRVNLSVPSGAADATTLTIELDGTATWVGARMDDRSLARQDAYAFTGPATVSLVLAPREPAGLTRLEEGPFVVLAPPALAEAARGTAREAAAALGDAAPFARSRLDDAPLHVLYTHEPVFAWEEGLYHGYDAISIRADEIADADAPPLAAVKTLVHEATHALVDRTQEGRPMESSFLSEGLARLAETHVELARPDDVIACETQGAQRLCTRASSRVDAEQLRAFLASGRTFDVAWNASSAAESERGFLYDYSGYVLLRYERRAPEGALGRVLDAIAGATLPEDPAAAASVLVDALLREAPALTRDALLYPGKDLASLDADAFAAALGDAVAPAFPAGGLALPAPGLALALLAVLVLAGARRRPS